MEDCGYIRVRNRDDARDGLWEVDGTRTAVYGNANLTLREQLKAISTLRSTGW